MAVVATVLENRYAVLLQEMSCKDTSLQETQKRLVDKTDECKQRTIENEQLRKENERLVREKADAGAFWKKQYEALVAKNGQNAI